MQFRRYRASDRSAILEVFRSNVPDYFRNEEEDDFLAFVEQEDCPYFVIEKNEQVIACGGYGFRNAQADLCWGMVRSDHHGRQIGKALLMGRLAFVARSHAEFVRLETSQQTDGFFSRYGFEVVERERDGIAEGLDRVEMRAPLSPAFREKVLKAWGVLESRLETGELSA